MAAAPRSSRSPIHGGRWVFVALAAVLSACGPDVRFLPSDDERPAGLARRPVARFEGCWELAWQLNGGVPTHGLLVTPDSVQLMSLPRSQGVGLRVLVANQPEGQSFDFESGEKNELPWGFHFSHNYWQHSGDTVRMRFSDGAWERWELTLLLTSDTLVGTAEYDSDAGPGSPPLKAGVAAVRFTCGTPAG